MKEIIKNPINSSGVPDQTLEIQPTSKSKKKNADEQDENILSLKLLNPLWLSVSETAKIVGITTKTVRRAIQSHKVIYKVVMDRYLIDLKSSLHFVFSNKKLKNKLTQKGIGQYIDKWKN
jgi:hypothetical protein